MKKYVAAIDQGTTSSRCIIFDHQSKIISQAQLEHKQIYPQPGWVEHDPLEIWQNTRAVIQIALEKANLTSDNLAAFGITNQRETTMLWNRKTGLPCMNAIVWQDTRTDGICRELAGTIGNDRFREKTGLPLATYFSGPKIRWMLEKEPSLQKLAKSGDLCFGTIDSWIIWNLTGGANNGLHITDVSNASRTLLMNLQTLKWDQEILQIIGIPIALLPEIVPSSNFYGKCVSPFDGVPVASILGDQQAALFGQTCFQAGEAKNTYGTGCFMLLNTGEKLIPSRQGLLTTVGYKIGDQKPVYCLEGSIAIAGALIQWLRDNLKIIQQSDQVEELARTVEDNGDIYFVPAFSGLFAPHWRSDARGVIVGMTRFINAGHIARASLEATAFQTREVLEAMNKDSGVPLTHLKVDGGMVKNNLLMQFQSDILQLPVIRPKISETTALGAAYAAGLAVGFWKNQEELLQYWQQDYLWSPKLGRVESEKLFQKWKKAVNRSLDWIE